MGSLSIPNFDDPGTAVLPPSKLAHMVLRTGDLEKMVSFYTTFLGGHVTHGNDFLSFITYDDEHHRIALIRVSGTSPKVPTSCGLEHVAFTFPTVAALLLAYRQRKAHGIPPLWCVNHGPTTSIYYKDPDGNMIETQVDNFETVEEANAFMTGREFAENPIGTDFDAEEWIERLKNGESEEVLKKRVEIGARALPEDLF
ncbi:hypothetical protein Z517_08180 [Fonsecaea pedrosoi CBS 271.37]|uniref:VOC domain-containing protein n=1 Tax=Fonsecaea pedrosoi CBS 271.37 TaxID=1442368 RepID=A0A0D2GIB7_9EURO|nr:uncharacterized protein Z517_08180 [Fonsecaea pedrosoi CBS 271.37]KIW78345.1 hypothetical protein Z517_08180 [Fonsecaea pedrosoi CBS 271.37]